MRPPGAVRPRRQPSERDAKRALDLAVAAAALLVLWPLLVVVALLVRLDSPGPVLFRQSRTGENGKPFLILKFRTMTHAEPERDVRQAVRGDGRVTRIGRVLRTTSLDELPQLLNVLTGEMSLVGPRPHALAHDERYGLLIATYVERHRVKPGITGWAQVRGLRGETATLALMERRIEHDLWYIENWSLWLDLRILARTVVALATQRDVY